MEHALNQATRACPFLHKASTETLRRLSTKAVAHSGPGPVPANALLKKAQQCPVMGRAMAAQISKLHTSATLSKPVASKPAQASVVITDELATKHAAAVKQAGKLFLRFVDVGLSTKARDRKDVLSSRTTTDETL